MMLEIDDNLDGKERRRQLDIQVIVYALKNNKSKTKAAKFLGLSLKGLSYKIYKYKELAEFIYWKPKFMQDWDEEKIAKYYNANKSYLTGQAKRYYDAWRNNSNFRDSESAS